MDDEAWLYGVAGLRSGWARCVCCAFLGYRFDNGLCGTCQYDDHTGCLPRHAVPPDATLGLPEGAVRSPGGGEGGCKRSEPASPPPGP